MMQILTFDGQEVEYFHKERILKLRINEPFHSAKTQYNWSENTEGLGINQKIIKFASQMDANIVLNIGNEKEYLWIEAWIWESFCEKTSSIYLKRVKNTDIKLYIFPISSLNKVELKDREIQSIL